MERRFRIIVGCLFSVAILVAGYVFLTELGASDDGALLDADNQMAAYVGEYFGQGETSDLQKQEVSVPLDRADERVTKKSFGIRIDPETSPVWPERFRGYHTGADFETFPEEAESDVSVLAICTGPLLIKRTATGYGGVVVQSCVLDDEPVTVVYGHLKFASITASVRDTLKKGETIGILGAGYSRETDGERKHLHLGIHRGTMVVLLGYVASERELDQWIDPCRFVCSSDNQ